MSKKRHLIYQLNMARHAMMKEMDAICKHEVDISVVQLTALMVLQQQKSCLMKDLAKALLLDKSAVTSLARRLEDKGLIKKVPSNNDARASFLTLTGKGKEKLVKGNLLFQEANKMIHGEFSEQELDIVSRYLHYITTTFSEAHKS